jgi:hypothetical protein
LPLPGQLIDDDQGLHGDAFPINFLSEGAPD